MCAECGHHFCIYARSRERDVRAFYKYGKKERKWNLCDPFTQPVIEQVCSGGINGNFKREKEEEGKKDCDMRGTVRVHNKNSYFVFIHTHDDPYDSRFYESIFHFTSHNRVTDSKFIFAMNWGI